jgi:hypothetical protein
VRYEGQRVAGVNNVVISTQIERNLDPAWVAAEVTREIIDPLLPANLRAPEFRIWVNPAGPFEIGGPNGDTGLTGRKIIVDTYGGACPHGGGAFSGKDPSKVDRSAAYMARYIAKNIVAAGLARRCLVQTRLCHRRRRAGVGDDRQPGHGRRGGCRARSGGEKGLSPDAERHHRNPRTGAAHLSPDRRLRPAFGRVGELRFGDLDHHRVGRVAFGKTWMSTVIEVRPTFTISA